MGNGIDVYYLCEQGEEKELHRRILDIYNNEARLGLKRPAYFKEAVEGHEKYSRIKGWFDLENNFMFFIDKEMYEKTLKLFYFPKK